MRALLLGVLVCMIGCKGAAGPEPSRDGPRAEVGAGASAQPVRGERQVATSTASARAAPVVSGGAVGAAAKVAGAPRTVRVYVAGESIERRTRWVAAPFLAGGALNERGGGEERNDDDEYGWAVPFADRLAIRDSGVKVEWVGADTWLDGDDNPYSGTYPPGGARRTSAVSGTSIDSWLEQRAAELSAKRHCYDVAIAARGGNDFGLDDDEAVKASLRKLVLALSSGSRCQKSPHIYVTGHMPDDQRGKGQGPADAVYVAQQKRRFVERFRAVVDELRASQPALFVRFVDLYTPFVENRATTAFAREVWSKNGIPDYAKIGRKEDRMHPRRLASIYAGELLADGVDIGAVRALP